MASTDELDSYLIKMGLPYEQVGDGTWVVRADSSHHSPIVIKTQDPIVLFSIPMFELTEDGRDHAALFQTLLELNSELLHTSYSLQGKQVVLAGAHQLANLDFNEFQAMIDDLCIALDNHLDKIAPWMKRGVERKSAMQAGGST